MAIFDYYGNKGNDDLLNHWRENPDDIGPSPGGAAAKLGVTRERVIQLTKDGHLDLHRVYRNRLQTRASEMYIGQKSLDEFIERVIAGVIITRRIKKSLDVLQDRK